MNRPLTLYVIVRGVNGPELASFEARETQMLYITSRPSRYLSNRTEVRKSDNRVHPTALEAWKAYLRNAHHAQEGLSEQTDAVAHEMKVTQDAIAKLTI